MGEQFIQFIFTIIIPLIIGITLGVVIDFITTKHHKYTGNDK